MWTHIFRILLLEKIKGPNNTFSIRLFSYCFQKTQLQRKLSKFPHCQTYLRLKVVDSIGVNSLMNVTCGYMIVFDWLVILH